MTRYFISWENLVGSYMLDVGSRLRAERIERQLRNQGNRHVEVRTVNCLNDVSHLPLVIRERAQQVQRHLERVAQGGPC